MEEKLWNLLQRSKFWRCREIQGAENVNKLVLVSEGGTKGTREIKTLAGSLLVPAFFSIQRPPESLSKGRNPDYGLVSVLERCLGTISSRICFTGLANSIVTGNNERQAQYFCNYFSILNNIVVFYTWTLVCSGTFIRYLVHISAADQSDLCLIG